VEAEATAEATAEADAEEAEADAEEATGGEGGGGISTSPILGLVFDGVNIVLHRTRGQSIRC
jgi:hypothetical protein